MVLAGGQAEPPWRSSGAGGCVTTGVLVWPVTAGVVARLPLFDPPHPAIEHASQMRATANGAVCALRPGASAGSMCDDAPNVRLTGAVGSTAERPDRRGWARTGESRR